MHAAAVAIRATRQMGRKSIVTSVTGSVKATAVTLKAALLTRKHLLVASLSFTTGAANVVTLIHYSAFGTVLTGNTIAFARNLVEQDWADAGYYASVVVTYWFGAIIAKAVVVGCKWRVRSLAPMVLVLLTVCDLGRWQSYDNRYTIVPFVAALGLVNTATATLDGVVTQMITGHWTTIAGEFMELTRKGRTLPLKDQVQLVVSLGVIFWFIAGVMVAQAVFGYAFKGDVPVGTFCCFGGVYTLLLWEHDKQELGLEYVLPRLAHIVTPKALLRALHGIAHHRSDNDSASRTRAQRQGIRLKRLRVHERCAA